MFEILDVIFIIVSLYSKLKVFLIFLKYSSICELNTVYYFSLHFSISNSANKSFKNLNDYLLSQLEFISVKKS